MIISKNIYDAKQYECIDHIFETVILNSSLYSDAKVLVKSLKKSSFSEYEEMLSEAHNMLIEKLKERAKELQADALFNFDVEVVVLYAGAWLVYASCDAVRSLA